MLDVPPAVVTVADTVSVPAGVVAVIWVLLTTVKDVAGATPKITEVVPENPVPLMITVLPPVTGPAFGLTEVMEGAGT